jgi:dTDP-4-amino-4,6-dideoxygalactose transaminase
MNFDILDDFEKALSDYTGAPYVVLTDCCTHAIELCLRHQKWQGPIIMPCNTYISVPMVLHKLGLSIYYDPEITWEYEYRLAPTNIWDSARAFDKDMYVPGRWQCLSFGHSKRLEIGHGGAILLDSLADHIALKCMTYDGRHLHHAPWQTQKHWNLGFHYNMRLEDAARGIELLSSPDVIPDLASQRRIYPDVSKIKINID